MLAALSGMRALGGMTYSPCTSYLHQQHLPDTAPGPQKPQPAVLVWQQALAAPFGREAAAPKAAFRDGFQAISLPHKCCCQ